MYDSINGGKKPIRNKIFDGFRGQTFPILFKECIALKRHVELCPAIANDSHT